MLAKIGKALGLFFTGVQILGFGIFCLIAVFSFVMIVGANMRADDTTAEPEPTLTPTPTATRTYRPPMSGLVCYSANRCVDEPDYEADEYEQQHQEDLDAYDYERMP